MARSPGSASPLTRRAPSRRLLYLRHLSLLRSQFVHRRVAFGPDCFTPRDRSPSSGDVCATDGAQLVSSSAQRAIARSARAPKTARRAGDSHLAQMKARVIRLDALGARLTEMADLDDGEFDFDATPALGGPEEPAKPVAGGRLQIAGRRCDR